MNDPVLNWPDRLLSASETWELHLWFQKGESIAPPATDTTKSYTVERKPRMAYMGTPYSKNSWMAKYFEGLRERGELAKFNDWMADGDKSE